MKISFKTSNFEKLIKNEMNTKTAILPKLRFTNGSANIEIDHPSINLSFSANESISGLDDISYDIPFEWLLYAIYSESDHLVMNLSQNRIELSVD